MGDQMDSTLAPFSCQVYEPNKCDPAKAPCPHVENCRHQEGMEHACYSVWRNNTVTGVKVILKGCWLAQDGEYNHCSKNECVADQPMRTTVKDIFKSGNEEKYAETTYYCCCKTPKCNERFEYSPSASVINNFAKGQSTVSRTGASTLSVLAYVVAPICVLACVILVCYFLYRRYNLRRETKRMALFSNRNGNGAVMSRIPSSPTALLKPIQLEEMVAKGRFGTVWKARMGDQLVAVKRFPPQDAESWSQEQSIYLTPGLKRHQNILHFIGSEVRGSGDPFDYWLITAYQENGSLHDYLKGHTISLSENLRISTGILRGLAFLHEESNSADDQPYKPTIVHRDFKSRNVLLNRGLEACIADFGLAVKCVHGRIPDDVHAQVGTRRYMSPEVLQGATDFSAIAFRQIDVYAAALVLWEVLSRCSFDGEKVDEYKLPYEEVGSRPPLEDLQQHVVVNMRRPIMKDIWSQHQKGAVICSTIEEMWDKEPEARITAGCAMERFAALQTAQLQAAKSSAPYATTENEIRATPAATAETLPLILNLNQSTSITIRIDPE